MLNRRALCAALLSGSAGLAACASGGDAPPRGHAEEGLEMLFISPMGEPFRARTPAPYPVVAWFNGADANSDGKLDLVEFLADAERFFHALDLTKDGVIDHREIFYYEHELVPEIIAGSQSGRLRRAPVSRLWLASNMEMAQLGGGPQGGGPIPGGVVGSGAPPANADGSSRPAPKANEGLVGAGPYNLLGDPEPVEGADIRLTGFITLSDWKTRAQQRFDVLDEDKKGYLTLAALPETQAQQLMPHHRGRRRG